MPLDKINPQFIAEVEQIATEGRAKAPERVINGYIKATDEHGPRYTIEGAEGKFIRMNSNSYLDLSNHPALVEAADAATHAFGVGPGAVRFIDGTYTSHIQLEDRIAEFCGYPSAKIFNSAYTANLAYALAVNSKTTYWVGDELNHNSIIRAMRISNVPRTNRAIYKHNDMAHLRECLEAIPAEMERVCIISDGIFSMRGDYAPLQEIQALANEYHNRFSGGVITVIDDSHGIGAFGESGRGTAEYTKTQPDVLIGTFGKAFGVNGGFVAGSAELVELIRQKADTYIYTNPLSPADCEAAVASIDILDSDEGKTRLTHLHDRIAQFRAGLDRLGLESIDGPHPVVPILIRDTAKTKAVVEALFKSGILVVGLTFPVVPKGDETIRVQINAGLTEADINIALNAIEAAV